MMWGGGGALIGANQQRSRRALVHMVQRAAGRAGLPLCAFLCVAMSICTGSAAQGTVSMDRQPPEFAAAARRKRLQVEQLEASKVAARGVGGEDEYSSRPAGGGRSKHLNLVDLAADLPHLEFQQDLHTSGGKAQLECRGDCALHTLPRKFFCMNTRHSKQPTLQSWQMGLQEIPGHVVLRKDVVVANCSACDWKCHVYFIPNGPQIHNLTIRCLEPQQEEKQQWLRAKGYHNSDQLSMAFLRKRSSCNLVYHIKSVQGVDPDMRGAPPPPADEHRHVPLPPADEHRHVPLPPADEHRHVPLPPADQHRHEQQHQRKLLQDMARDSPLPRATTAAQRERQIIEQKKREYNDHQREMAERWTRQQEEMTRQREEQERAQKAHRDAERAELARLAAMQAREFRHTDTHACGHAQVHLCIQGTRMPSYVHVYRNTYMRIASSHNTRLHTYMYIAGASGSPRTRPARSGFQGLHLRHHFLFQRAGEGGRGQQAVKVQEAWRYGHRL